MKKFSIIIPCLNCQDTIRESLDSLSSQSFKNYELIIIDSLSKDNSLNIIKHYKNKISSLTVISEEDNGIYDAMNKGIAKSNSQWLIFLGSDDQLYNSDILKNLNNLINNQKLSKEIIVLNSSINNNVHANNFSWRILLNNTINHQGIVYPSKYLKSNLYNTKYILASDYEANLKIYLNKNITKFKSNLVLTKYSMNGLSSKNYMLGQKEIASIRLRYLGFFGVMINLIMFARNLFRK